MEKTEFEVTEENKISEMLRIKRIEEIRKIKRSIVRLFFEHKNEHKISYRNLAACLGCSVAYLLKIESQKEKPSKKILLGMLGFIC